jgi:hypothetical protein
MEALRGKVAEAIVLLDDREVAQAREVLFTVQALLRRCVAD